MANEGTARGRLPILLGVLTLALGIAAGGYLYFGRGASPREAQANLWRLAEAAVAYARAQQAEPRLPASSDDWTPRGVACHQPGKRFAPDPATWAAPPWSELGFSLDGPSAYQYRVTRAGAARAERLTIEARADLDCDSVYSRYALTVDAALAIGPLEAERAGE